MFLLTVVGGVLLEWYCDRLLAATPASTCCCLILHIIVYTHAGSSLAFTTFTTKPARIQGLRRLLRLDYTHFDGGRDICR